MVHYSEMNPVEQKRYFAKLRRKNFHPIPFRDSIQLLTLATNTTLIADMLDTNLGEDYFFISMDILATIREQSANEGPIEFGIAHEDYSAAEVEEHLSVSFVNPDNKIEQERARRKVRRVGHFPGLLATEVFNDGRKYRQTIKFSVGNGFNMSFFAANRSSAALTTGTVIEFSGTFFGRWQR